ncbi:GntR family transcriptional regulator [Cryobacterium tepidiphilum]|uniref:GntR family transcriptional regulator n=1 Tax=Cryobacterium tepidiphilum TaxID=2486026 RepID=A0A3M8LQN5_9MICO|nr:GntR family transcriptional regulator [Cryobacterium tepidiphilum]RNE67024.1 GntR family transcriptional regulator [Cryobacterium tepidiphilum]
MDAQVDRYSTKSDFAYAEVRGRIVTGVYPPGTVLNQAALAAELGISTTPLRESLRRLKSEGLVELDAHRDARVTDLSAEEARDLLEIRRALDPLAAGLAAERRTKDDIAEMRAALSELEPLPNQPAVVDLVAHRRFHRAVYCASHNDLLIATLDGLWDKADRYRLVGLEERRQQPERDRKANEHRELFAAVTAGDREGVQELMLRHIRSSLGAKAASRLAASETHHAVA